MSNLSSTPYVSTWSTKTCATRCSSDRGCWIHEASMSRFVMTALKKNDSFLRAHFSAVFLGVFPPNSGLKLQVSSSSYLDSDHGWHVGGPLLGYAVSRRTTVFLWVVPGCCTMQLECPCKDAEDDSMAVEIRNHHCNSRLMNHE